MGADDNHAPAESEEDAHNTARVTALLNDLRDRAKNLLTELETFKEHLKSIRQESKIETAHYHGQVRSELGMLERLPVAPASYHIAKSSNLPFLETVWHIAKSQSRVVALQKRFFFPKGPPGEAQPVKITPAPPPRRRRRGKTTDDASCIVDAVVDNGHKWFKISLVSNNRLLFDLAKRGWEVGESDSDSALSERSEDEDDLLPLVKMARDLSSAAKATRVQTKHPHVVLILPRVVTGEAKEIDKIVDDCRATGVEIICRPKYSPDEPVLQATINTMAPSPFSALTDELNIDCTILLAIVSEFSHAKVSKEPWFHTALQRQVEIEGNENLLPTLLYPAMGSRELVCTDEAAQRMWEIVDTIGTPSEKARTAIMMGQREAADKSQEELITQMETWSAYDVPADWQLPIRVVAFDIEKDPLLVKLPSEATTICADMTLINKSIFMYGWASGKTTITSNRTIVKQMETTFDKFDDVDEASWPKIWLCPTARSLVGKEKRGVKKIVAGGAVNQSNGKKDVIALPDPLKRENQRRNGLDILSLKEGHEVEDLRPNGYDYADVMQAKQNTHY